MQAICIVGVEADFDQGGSDPHVNFSTDDSRQRIATSHRRRSKHFRSVHARSIGVFVAMCSSIADRAG